MRICILQTPNKCCIKKKINPAAAPFRRGWLMVGCCCSGFSLIAIFFFLFLLSISFVFMLWWRRRWIISHDVHRFDRDGPLERRNVFFSLFFFLLFCGITKPIYLLHKTTLGERHQLWPLDERGPRNNWTRRARVIFYYANTETKVLLLITSLGIIE